MKTGIFAYPIILTISGNLAVAKVTPISTEAIAEYLSSLSPSERESLASKLYYLDPQGEKSETKRTLLDELTKQGRVKSEASSFASPRTISTEAGL